MSDSALATPPTETTTLSPETTTSETTPAPQSDAPTSLLSEEPAPAPEPFDAEKITFPEGITKDDALFDDFKNLAAEHKLTAPVAQSLIDLAAKQVQAAAQRQSTEWAKQNEDWQTEIRADKDIGGDKLERSLQTFAKVASDPSLSDPKLREALAYTGAGNNPAIVRTLVKWANALSEGAAVRGNPAGGTRQPETLGDAIYGREGPHVGGPKR